MNLAAHVLAAGLQHPDRLALTVLGQTRTERWSHARLRAAVLGTATGLRRAGLGPGDRLLLRLGNRPAFPVAFLGAIAAGIVPVPTSAALTAPEIARIGRLIAPAATLAGEGLPLPDPPGRIVPDSALDGFATLPPAPFAASAPDDLAYIVFTSGSSGAPRAVMHAHRAIRARAAMMTGWYDLRPDDRMLHAGAFNWTFTLGTGLLDPWTLGATALVPAEGTPIEALPLLARRHGATLLAGAPGVFRRMLRADWAPWPGLRHGLTAGERLDPELRAAWQARTGTDLHEAMGASECSTFLSGSPARPAPPGSAGYAQHGRAPVAVLDPAGAPLPPGAEGDLAVGADDPGLMLGYWGDPAASAARRRGAYFVTGDRAVIAADGAVTVLGRGDDMLNVGGFRVSPAEIETHLAACDGAGEVAAFAASTPSGASLIALALTGPATDAALAAHAAAGLADWKRPRMWVRLPALPRTPTGKIDRRALRLAHGVLAARGSDRRPTG